MKWLWIALGSVFVLWAASFTYFTFRYPVTRDTRLIEVVQKHRAKLHANTEMTPEVEAAIKTVATWASVASDAGTLLNEAFGPIYRPGEAGLGAVQATTRLVSDALKAQDTRMAEMLARTTELPSVLKVLESPSNYGCLEEKLGEETRCSKVMGLMLPTLKVASIHLLQNGLRGDTAAFDAVRRSLGRIDDALSERNFSLIDRMMLLSFRNQLVATLGVVLHQAINPQHQGGARETLSALKLEEPTSMLEAMESEMSLSATAFGEAAATVYRPFSSQSVMELVQVEGDRGLLHWTRWLEGIATTTGVLRHSLNLGETEALAYANQELLLSDIRDFENAGARGSFKSTRFDAQLKKLQEVHESKQPYAFNYFGELLMLIAVPNYAKFVERFHESRTRSLSWRSWLLGGI
jgi:hypothetical protein